MIVSKRQKWRTRTEEYYLYPKFYIVVKFASGSKGGSELKSCKGYLVSTDERTHGDNSKSKGTTKEKTRKYLRSHPSFHECLR